MTPLESSLRQYLQSQKEAAFAMGKEAALHSEEDSWRKHRNRLQLIDEILDWLDQQKKASPQ